MKRVAVSDDVRGPARGVLALPRRRGPVEVACSAPATTRRSSPATASGRSGVFAHPLLRHARLPRLPRLDATSCRSSDRPSSAPASRRSRRGCGRCSPRWTSSITHDIVYLPHHLAYNVACRELAGEFPDVRWLHWIHSAPTAHRSFTNGDPRGARFTPFPGGGPRLSERLRRPAGREAVRASRRRRCAIVPHALDYDEIFGFHPMTRALVEKYDLYEPAILAVYPCGWTAGSSRRSSSACSPS